MKITYVEKVESNRYGALIPTIYEKKRLEIEIDEDEIINCRTTGTIMKLNKIIESLKESIE